MFYSRLDGWMGGTEYQKCPSMFFILCGYIEHIYIYLLVYILKSCHKHSYGFQKLMSSCEWGLKFSKSPNVGDFSIFRSKSSLFLNTSTGCKFDNHTHTQAPTVSLRRSGQIYTTRPEGPSLRVGRGIKSVLQCSTYFVGLYNIVYIYMYIFSKIVTNMPMGFKF